MLHAGPSMHDSAHQYVGYLTKFSSQSTTGERVCNIRDQGLPILNVPVLAQVPQDWSNAVTGFIACKAQMSELVGAHVN